mgnify:CR=1 FL=1
MVDGRIDGHFRIDKGGITQGIQKELGLSSQECKQLGSVWTQIINEFDDSNNMQVSNNKNETPNKSNNYKVHKDAIVQFSKDCWKRIVDLVNKTLHKNIQAEEVENVEETANTSLKSNNDTSTTNKQNIENAYNELKSMTGLFVQKYKLDENKFTKLLEQARQGTLESLPENICNSADFAMSMLMEVFNELMPNNKKEAVKNALIEVAQHYKDIEGANIAKISCKDIIENPEKIDELTNRYLGTTVDTEKFTQVAKDAISELINNFDKMTFPKEVDKQEVLNKLKNYKPENIQNLSGHYRFGLKLNENPSKADIAVAILSDILGMNGAKEDREIKSEITLRQTAVNNVMNIYDDDMTLRGTKFSEVKNRAEQHQQAIDEARNYIKSNFKASGLEKQVDEKLFMECLNNITLDIESKGAGRVEDGILAIETNDTDISEWTEDGTVQANMVKLLVHEAYHLYLDKDGKHTKEATKEEEATAEMLALRTMANLCKNDSSLKPFEIYGQSISDFTSNETIANNPKFNSDFLASYTKHTGTVEDAIRKAKENVKL